jgi:hypothetical protein
MDLPVVNQKQQPRPALKLQTMNQLVDDSEGEEQALYVLLGATGMRISEALALETKHLVNDGRPIEVRQQVHRHKPIIVPSKDGSRLPGHRREYGSRRVPASLCQREEWVVVQDPERHPAALVDASSSGHAGRWKRSGVSRHP